MKNQSKGKNLVRLSAGLPILENENLKIQINSNGTFNVFDKPNKIHFNSLGYFYDEGEAAHAWAHSQLKPFITTLKQKPEIKITSKGPLYSEVSIIYKWRIQKDRLSSNTKAYTEIPITVFVSLIRNSMRVDHKIHINNTAENHRLPIMSSSNLNTEYSYAEGQFDVVKRSTKRIDARDWVEQPMYDYPLHHFVDLCNNKNGCAVILHGLKEYEVLNDAQKTLAVTLLRAFTYVIQPSSKEDYSHKKGSQCLGHHEYSISFYPHKGNWDEGKVYEQALNFNNDVRLFQSGNLTGRLSPSSSFIQIQPTDLIFSCFKNDESDGDSYILRIYNPTEREVNGLIKFLLKLRRLERVSLEEKFYSQALKRDAHTLQVKLRAKEIQTFGLLFNK